MTNQQIIKQYDQVNRKFERLFYPKVRKAINAKRDQLAAKVRSVGVERARNWLSEDVGNVPLAKIIEKLYLVVGLRHARMNYLRMLAERKRIEQKGFGFNDVWTNFILGYFRRYLLEKITYEVSKTTKDALLAILTNSIAQGWSTDQAVDTVRGWDARYQAARVVRTETNRAANAGAKANSETLEYQQQKEWVSAQDYRVRGRKPHEHADHWALNGTKIDAEDKFVDPVNGDQLDFPGDITASAASVINCRCVAVYTAKRDENGNLIPKRKTTFVQYPGAVRRRQTVTV